MRACVHVVHVDMSLNPCCSTCSELGPGRLAFEIRMQHVLWHVAQAFQAVQGMMRSLTLRCLAPPTPCTYHTVPWLQYILYKHFLLHGLNISCALRQPNETAGLAVSSPFRLYWLSLNAAYVLEFFLQVCMLQRSDCSTTCASVQIVVCMLQSFGSLSCPAGSQHQHYQYYHNAVPATTTPCTSVLPAACVTQTLVKKGHMAQRTMLTLNQLLMTITTAPALMLLASRVDLPLAMLSVALNFVNRGHEQVNVGLVIAAGLMGGSLLEGQTEMYKGLNFLWTKSI